MIVDLTLKCNIEVENLFFGKEIPEITVAQKNLPKKRDFRLFEFDIFIDQKALN